MEVMKDYVAHLDNKKRITLRGAAYQYYNVVILHLKWAYAIMVVAKRI